MRLRGVVSAGRYIKFPALIEILYWKGVINYTMGGKAVRIAVVFGSQRNGGTHHKIEVMINNLDINHEFDFIRMAETKIEACVACEGCTSTGVCILPSGQYDMFHEVLHRLMRAEVIMIITPVYAPIPSRLTALFERLLSISFFSHEIGKLDKPLRGKRTTIVCYDSNKIGDDTQVKIIFQRFLMDDYSFINVDYAYINSQHNLNERYPNVIEYVKDIVINQI